MLKELIKDNYDKGFIPCIRKVGFSVEEDKSISKWMWISEGYAEFEQIKLIIGDFIEIELGGQVCDICHEFKNKLDRGICLDCIDIDSPFSIRISCMFRSENSPLYLSPKCDKNNLSCNLSENKKYCHSKHVLYLGRFRDRFKVGTTRKNRKGAKFIRQIEQGLNEAIIIEGFNSLPEVLTIEDELIESDFNESISFDDKRDALNYNGLINYPELWSNELLSKKFRDKKIVHKLFYPEVDFKDLRKREFNHLFGQIKFIQGPIIITEYKDENYIWDSRQFLHRQIINLKVGDEQWYI